MAKPNDIRNRLAAPPPAASGNTFSLNKPASHEKPDGRGQVSGPRPDKGFGSHKPGKAQGGAGQSSARPKV